MFTKYNGITLPQNYSGNRFKAYPNDTETKTHKPQEAQPLTTSIRTSVSPTFRDVTREVPVQEDVPDEIYEEPPFESRGNDPLREENEEIIHTPPRENQCEASNEAPQPVGKIGLEHLFGNLQSDDILLLTLIFILAKDSSAQSPDAILILALLLFLH